jgi:hypothetical protein
MQCLSESGPLSAISDLRLHYLEENGLYRMTCKKGHESVTCLQQMKFELLFDLGVYAMLDGYYREAVSSFTAALERFYEFFIEVQCDRAGIDQATFEKAWKHVSNESQRQLGGFIFLYLLEMKHPPSILRTEEVGFRNAVIHKGRIPSRTEAMDYGDRVSEIILEGLAEVRRKDEPAIHRAIQRHMKRLNTLAAGSNLATMTALTMISVTRSVSEPQPTLVEWIKMLEIQRAILPPGSAPATVG